MGPSFLLVFVACIAYYIYRFYKTVAKYPPGPRPLPIIGNIHQLELINTHKWFEKMSHVYGPVFTVFLPRPTVIITRLPEMKEALIKKGDIFAGRSQSPIESLFQSMDNGGVIFSEKESWKEQRRFAVHTLRDFGMGRNCMEEKILNSVCTMVEQINELANLPSADMNWPIQLCVGNIINELLFDHHYEPDNCAKFIEFKDLFERVLHLMRNRASVLIVQAYPWLVNVPIIGHHGYWDLRKDMLVVLDFIHDEIRENKKKIDYHREQTCFVNAYLQEMKRREEKGEDMGSFSELQLTNVLMDFWLAGMETTATTLRWAIVLLTAHPEIQKKLQAEIDAVVGKDRQPSMSDKSNMPYSSAVVMELQRKSNIVTLNNPHKTTQDTDIGGLFIPKNCAILPQVSTVLDNPEVYANPERFEPERFLEADGKTFNKTAVEHLVPFSLGKRQCAGESLARMELFLILVVLMQRYSFVVPENGSPPDLTPIYGATQVPLPYECKIQLRS
uniref:Cytochrome P450 n=1 Tax=Plectus sambesii TaxID=2011161 RepID=A0A914VFG1_9BILA